MPRPAARSLVLAAAAALALPAAARAGSPQPVHVLSVALPDGSVARIRYVGDVPPSLTLRAPAASPSPVAVLAPIPASPVAFDDAAFDAASGDPGFAALERMQLVMQRQAEAMLDRAAATEAAMVGSEPDAGGHTALLPAAANGVGCVVGTRITQEGDAAPRVVSFRSAGCGGAATVPGGASDRVPERRSLDAVPGAARPLPGSGSRLIEARADQAAPLGLPR